MKYKEMIEDAKANGLTSEKIMWESIDDLDNMLCIVKREHPEEYWKFMRNVHGHLYGNHYNEKFAQWDVDNLHYTNAKGEKKQGAHWTAMQVEDATRGMSFPNGTTIWDKYVAANASYADFCKKFSEEQILDIMYLFFFMDEDWKGGGKIWSYMQCNR